MLKFAVYLTFLVAIVGIATPTVGQQEPTEGLTNFLTEKMRIYTSWLTDQKYDPSPELLLAPHLLQTDIGSSSNVFLRLDLNSLKIAGQSNKYVDYSKAQGNLATKTFYVNHTTTMRYQGSYSAEIKIKVNATDTYQFRANGNYQLAPRDKFTQKLSYSDYIVNDDDHINISETEVETKSVYNFIGDVDRNEVHFDNLYDDDVAFHYRNDIQLEIATVFNNWMNVRFYNKTLYPGRQLLRIYLRELFAGTKLEEIKAWPEPRPLPPTTTPRATTTTTKIRPTTTGRPGGSNLFTGNCALVIVSVFIYGLVTNKL